MTGQAAQSLGAGALAIGDLIAQKYRVEGIVGRGGMGVVISARHVQLGQTVAIKLLTLPPDEDRRDEAIGRFLNEAQAAARLRSDHVVRIYDVGQLENGLPFIVMELLSGADLGTVLDDRGALPEAEAVDLVLQACAGVAEAHQLGVVHRDLKPSNLFVTRRSDGLPLLKVLDFGISKQLSDPESGEALPTFTSTRTLMGSPNYMSPEQIRDARRVDARTDIWALGIIMQELVTAAPVFRGESFPGVCAAIVADPPMAVRTLRPDISDELEAVIERCLQKDVTKRYQSVAELAAALSPLGLRAPSGGAQAVTYSSGSSTLVTAGGVKSERQGSRAALDGPTVAVPLASSLSISSRPDRTLESARLGVVDGGTQTAVSSPDSRIERVEMDSRVAPEPRPLGRFFLPLGLIAVALGVLWFRGHAPTAAPSTGVDASAPAPATASPFTLSIDSEPPGASVSEGSVRLGTTPFSLTLDLAEGSSPRVFVVEKLGYQPYVVRQGPARGQVRVVAALSPTLEPRAERAASTAPVEPARRAAVEPSKPSPPALKRAPAPNPKLPTDIRLER